jgi:hypothetical protein
MFVSLQGVLLFSWRYHLCSFIYGDGLHKLLKFNQIIWNVFEKIAILYYGAPGSVCIFGARIYVFTRHWPIVDKLLIMEYE